MNTANKTQVANQAVENLRAQLLNRAGGKTFKLGAVDCIVVLEDGSYKPFTDREKAASWVAKQKQVAVIFEVSVARVIRLTEKEIERRLALE